MNRRFMHTTGTGLSLMKNWLVLIFIIFAICVSAYYFTVQQSRIDSQIESLVIYQTYQEVKNKTKSDPEFPIPLVWKPISPSPLNVFFVETSCAFKTSVKPGFLHLSKRQACAIYSTAILNPKHRIIIIHTCPLVEDYSQRWEEDWPELLTLGNVGVVEAGIPWLLSDTPVASLLDGRLNSSAYPVEHTSDLVRLALLYKYGGTYLDSDIISIKPLDGLGYDYIGAEESTSLANGIMNFRPTDEGHIFVEEILYTLKSSFEGSSWAANGPTLVTNQLRNFCKLNPTQPLDKLGKLGCGITVQPINVFYPIPYWEWKQFFDESAWPKIRDQINNTFILHFWNKLSKGTVVHVGSKQPYGIVAANYCSPIYHKNGNLF